MGYGGNAARCVMVNGTLYWISQDASALAAKRENITKNDCATGGTSVSLANTGNTFNIRRNTLKHEPSLF